MIPLWVSEAVTILLPYLGMGLAADSSFTMPFSLAGSALWLLVRIGLPQVPNWVRVWLPYQWGSQRPPHLNPGGGRLCGGPRHLHPPGVIVGLVICTSVCKCSPCSSPPVRWPVCRPSCNSELIYTYTMCFTLSM